LFKPIIINNNITNHFLPELLFQYDRKLDTNKLNSIIDEQVLYQIKEDVKTLLGPFSNSLSHNLFFLFDRFFKYCPKCLEEGNLYLFHQFTFLDHCLIHNVPLIKQCPVCKQRKFSTFSFNKNRYYICPNCNSDLFQHFSKYSPVELVAKSYRDKPVLLNLTPISDESCTIIDINPSHLKIKKILPDSAAKFIKTYLLTGEKSRAVTISLPKVKKNTKYKMSNLQNYYSDCDCNYINYTKDYKKNDLSMLSSIENIIGKVNYRIKKSFRVGYHCENINRTNINYKTKLNNIFVKCLYGYKTIRKEQYAYYLWLYSCILRNRAGKCNPSFLIVLYENLIQLCYTFFNDTKSTVISFDVFELASKIVEFYLFEYFCRLLDLIENNIKNGSYIKLITEYLIDFGISDGPAYKCMIIERKFIFDVYFFEDEESQLDRNHCIDKDHNETFVGGYDLIERPNISIP
jgi:hypothetical protein